MDIDIDIDIEYNMYIYIYIYMGTYPILKVSSYIPMELYVCKYIYI